MIKKLIIIIEGREIIKKIKIKSINKSRQMENTNGMTKNIMPSHNNIDLEK
jgi:hypothetical protein